ncbi:hypothetical protein EII17_14195 [Clostridiales bacterium COT073_COT-073]|nr:hypothetical protein EII17_14195 [Clostridiales bacterium COT073_COT-073]
MKGRLMEKLRIKDLKKENQYDHKKVGEVFMRIRVGNYLNAVEEELCYLDALKANTSQQINREQGMRERNLRAKKLLKIMDTRKTLKEKIRGFEEMSIKDLLRKMDTDPSNKKIADDVLEIIFGLPALFIYEKEKGAKNHE